MPHPNPPQTHSLSTTKSKILSFAIFALTSFADKKRSLVARRTPSVSAVMRWNARHASPSGSFNAPCAMAKKRSVAIAREAIPESLATCATLPFAISTFASASKTTARWHFAPTARKVQRWIRVTSVASMRANYMKVVFKHANVAKFSAAIANAIRRDVDSTASVQRSSVKTVRVDSSLVKCATLTFADLMVFRVVRAAAENDSAKSAKMRAPY